MSDFNRMDPDALDRWITREPEEDPRVEKWVEEAYSRGKGAALAAATWVTDGNESDGSRRNKLAMMDNGDPAIDDYLPAYPTLSGEWAGDPTPLSLARDITGEDDPDPDLIDTLSEAWEEGVSENFQEACERELRAWVGGDQELDKP